MVLLRNMTFFDKYINKAPSKTAKRCHKMDKKGMELSLNMIIYVILGLVFLGVALGFITGYIPQLLDSLKGFPQPSIPPTSDKPISFIPSYAIRNRDVKMTVSFLNTEAGDVPATVVPQIRCSDIPDVRVKASGLNVPVGEVRDYHILVWVPKTTTPAMYACTMTVSQTEDTFILEVK